MIDVNLKGVLPFVASICGISYFIERKTPFTFIAMTWSQVDTEYFAIGTKAPLDPGVVERVVQLPVARYGFSNESLNFQRI